MKNYIKPTAEVIELSVKESLSALPSNLAIRKVARMTSNTATVYATASVNDSTITEG